MNDLLELAKLYGQLSVLAVGGVQSVIPEMQRQVVTVHHWMPAEEFATLFALGQAAPGPNLLVATLVGARVAGLPGAAVATISMLVPSSLLILAVASAWHRFRDHAWRRRLQAGLVPLTAGLVIAASILLVRSTTTGAGTALVTVTAAAALVATRAHPVLLLAAGAVLGVLGA